MQPSHTPYPVLGDSGGMRFNPIMDDENEYTTMLEDDSCSIPKSRYFDIVSVPQGGLTLKRKATDGLLGGARIRERFPEQI